jgi:soluble lytic murein transglycosylase-like protein
MQAHYRAVENGQYSASTVRAIHEAANIGDPDAVEVLAWMYVHGKGVTRHHCSALHLYLYADTLGVSNARANARAIADKLDRPCRLARALAQRLDAKVMPRQDVPEDIGALLLEAARHFKLDAALLHAVAHVESSFRPDVVSEAGARGVMQIMPDTARKVFNVDPDRLFDARTNIFLGARFLVELIRRYGAVEPALSHYYSGRVRKTAQGYVPHPIALAYVQRVQSAHAAYQASGL